MVGIESTSHQKALMDGMNRLRLEGTLTDVTLCSNEGDCFNMHSIILKALGINDLVPIHPQPFVARLDVSTTALKIITSYLYTGIFDSPSTDSTGTDRNIFEDIATVCNQYGINSLSQVVNCYRKLDWTVKEANKPPCTISAEVVQPFTGNNDQHRLQVSHEQATMSEDRLETSAVQDNEKTLPLNDVQHQGENVSTKQLLKRFLHTKSQDVMANRNSMQSHRQSSKPLVPEKHSAKIFCCHLCGKVLTKKGYPAHMKVHSNIKDKTCEVCGKRFRKACNLTEHWQRMHSLSKAYTCSRCGSSFAIKSDLTRHVARHRKTCFVCELCGASFVGKVMWKKHKCMDDIFINDGLGSVFVDPTSSTKPLNDKNEHMEEDILSISTLLPLDFTDNTGTREILSEVDGLFYENGTEHKPAQFTQ